MKRQRKTANPAVSNGPQKAEAFEMPLYNQTGNDPNEWSEDPRYIVDLVKRVVQVSVKTVAIVKSLPDLNEQTFH
jgi:hypothetical protein